MVNNNKENINAGNDLQNNNMNENEKKDVDVNNLSSDNHHINDINNIEQSPSNNQENLSLPTVSKKNPRHPFDAIHFNK